MMKRVFDITFSLLALVVLSPIIIVVAILVRIILGSPVIYAQPRPGLNCEQFMLYKFRSMTEESGDDGELLPDHQRLMAFGQMLRRFSLDELPTLWNVLKGDMSIVGPRPLLVEYLPLYSDIQNRRHETRPGITGWAQVNGRNAISWEDKFRFDVWYVDNRSIWLDFRIMGRTLWKVLKGEGISHPGEATMTRFAGSVVKNVQEQGPD